MLIKCFWAWGKKYYKQLCLDGLTGCFSLLQVFLFLLSLHFVILKVFMYFHNILCFLMINLVLFLDHLNRNFHFHISCGFLALMSHQKINWKDYCVEVTPLFFFSPFFSFFFFFPTWRDLEGKVEIALLQPLWLRSYSVSMTWGYCL